MWTRKELKDKAKERFRLNYWKGVLAAMLLALICGGAGTGVQSGMYTGFLDKATADEEDLEDIREAEEYEQIGLEDLEKIQDGPDLEGDIAFAVFLVLLILAIVVVFVVILLIVLPLQIFVFNPMEVGTRRFFTRNLKEQANMREVCFTFDHSYKNGVKIMFFRDLYTFLWSLLFLIPGIVKSYEYKMIPYILGENPDMPMEEVFARSRAMMYGNKWKAFVLDLSFVGWYILTGLTLGILGIFYVNPYVYQTHAALYQRLKELKTAESQSTVSLDKAE